MAIPLTYNLRNLTVRKTTTLMTALGVGLTVAVLLSVLALVSGLNTAFDTSAHPLQIVVTRKGSESELSSSFPRPNFQELKSKAGIARAKDGEPMASLELITVVNLPSVDSPDGMNVTARGISPVGMAMRENARIVEGRWFEPGKRELVVGKSIAKRYPAARLGGTLKFGRGDWTVVGVLDGGRSSANSEIFGDGNQLAGDYNRTELSAVRVRAVDEVTVQALINDLNDDRRLNASARSEKEFYDAQTVSGAPIRFFGIFISAIMAIGSSFAAMNTMYAAVARRAKEIGTLRVLGFSRGGILLSFFIESLLLSLIGGALGCLLVLPLNGITTGIGNFATFSEIAFDFRITPAIMASGLIFAALMGAFGGLLPARMAARKEILVALREG